MRRVAVAVAATEPRRLSRPSDELETSACCWRYHRDGDLDAREELVLRFMPLARQLASRYRHAGEPLEDLVQVACVGSAEGDRPLRPRARHRLHALRGAHDARRAQAPLPRQGLGACACRAPPRSWRSRSARRSARCRRSSGAPRARATSPRRSARRSRTCSRRWRRRPPTRPPRSTRPRPRARRRRQWTLRRRARRRGPGLRARRARRDAARHARRAARRASG